MISKDMKLAYTVPEAAEAIGVSTDTIWRLLKRRELKPVKIGHRTIIRKAEIDAFLDRKAEAA